MYGGKSMRRSGLCAALLVVTAGGAWGHVGSPDVFLQGKAGAYPVLVAVRPPNVIPGIARVEIRSLGDGVQRVEVFPTPVSGEAAKHPPLPDVAERSIDPKYFVTSVWLMSFGAWAIHVRVSGANGMGELLVPVPALAYSTRPLPSATGYFLTLMTIFLTVGMIAIVGASVREAHCEPGVESTPWNRSAVAAMAIASAVLLLALWQGGKWWAEDDASKRRNVYVPLRASATLDAPDHLTVQIIDPGWTRLRRLDDLVPDHGHLMHLFLVRWPAMDEVFHLHPAQLEAGFFGLDVPSLPAGKYRLYGDIVHESGIPETAVGDVTLPDITGKPLSGDDSGGANTTDLGGGYHMVRLRPARPIAAKQVELFTFAITGPDGKRVSDLEPYMGMGGHAEFISTDGSVFAHVHPTGSVPMASVAVASPEAMLAMHERKVGPTVSFPYGVPSPGRYRIFVQLKRTGQVYTGGFEIEAH